MQSAILTNLIDYLIWKCSDNFHHHKDQFAHVRQCHSEHVITLCYFAMRVVKHVVRSNEHCVQRNLHFFTQMCFVQQQVL